MHITESFNNPATEFEPFVDEHTDAGPRGSKLDCRLLHFRDAEYLKQQWNANIRSVTEVFGNWTKSGQMDPDNIWDFCRGDRVAYYTLKVLMENNLLYAVTKTVPPDEAFDAGVQLEATAGDGIDGGMCAPASGAQGVKRMKVGRGAGRRKSGGTSSSTAARGDTSATPQVTKVEVLRDKVEHDRRRKDAAFAREVFGDKNMPSTVTAAAEKMLLEFFGCSSTTEATPHCTPVEAAVPPPSSDSDSL